MISIFRKLFDSWLGRLLAIGFVVLIGLAFALGDVTGSLGGGVSGDDRTVANVGDLQVESSDYAAALRSQYEIMRQQNPTLDMTTFLESGGADGVFERLVASYAAAAFADEYGIAASKAMIDSEISSIPGLRGLDGKFDATAYQAFLQDRNITDEQLRQDLRRSFIAEQLLGAATFGLTPPEKALRNYAEISFESRSGKVAIIPSMAFAPDKGPTDEQLQSFYKDNSRRFTVPEQRSFSYALFTPEIVAEKAQPTDAEIAEYYKQNEDEFAASKSVTFEQLVVTSEDAAKNVESRVKAGEKLASVAKELGYSTSQQSSDSQRDLASSAGNAVAKAIYGTDVGELAPPAKGEFGFVVARVTSIDEKPAQSLANSRAQISALVAEEKQADALAELTMDIQDRFEDGASLAEVAKDYDLTVVTTPLLLANGTSPENGAYSISDEEKPLVAHAFDAYRDDPPQLVQAGEGSFAMVALKQIKEAAPPPLVEVRNTVIAAWKMNEGDAAAKKAGEKAAKAVKQGKSFAEAIASINAKLPAPQTISGSRQDLARMGQNVPPALYALFQIPENGSRLVPVGSDRGYLLIQVDDVTAAEIASDDARLPQFRQGYSASLAKELQRQFVAAMQKDVGVEVNEDARAAVRQRLEGAD